jgi:hypothetical protein
MPTQSGPTGSQAEAKTPKPDESKVKLTPENFARIYKLVKPLPGEFAWRDEIPWLISIREARQKAAKEGKPLFLYTAADGHPCGSL